MSSSHAAVDYRRHERARTPPTFESCFDTSKTLTLEVLEAQWDFLGTFYSTDEASNLHFRVWHHEWWKSFSPMIVNYSSAVDHDGNLQWAKLVCASAIIRKRANDASKGINVNSVALAKSLYMPEDSPFAIGRRILENAVRKVSTQVYEMSQQLLAIGKKLEPIRNALTGALSLQDKAVIHDLFRGFWRRTGLFIMSKGLDSDYHRTKLLRWSDQQSGTWQKHHVRDTPLNDVRGFFDALPSPRDLAIELKWLDDPDETSRLQTAGVRGPQRPRTVYTPIARAATDHSNPPSVLGKRPQHSRATTPERSPRRRLTLHDILNPSSGSE